MVDRLLCREVSPNQFTACNFATPNLLMQAG